MKSNCVLKAFPSQGLIIDYISMDFPELSLIETICYETISELKTNSCIFSSQCCSQQTIKLEAPQKHRAFFN